MVHFELSTGLIRNTNHHMKQQHPLVYGVTAIAAFGVVAAVLATMVAAATPGYAVKVRVTDKIESAKIFEGIVLEQTKGKTNVLGDKMNFRVLSTATAYNKNNKKQSNKNWLGAVQNEDIVTAVGNYKKSDNTFELVRTVNRSR